MMQTLLRMTASVVLLGLSAHRQTSPRPIVIEKVTVIDVAAGQRRLGMTVLISEAKLLRSIRGSPPRVRSFD